MVLSLVMIELYYNPALSFRSKCLWDNKHASSESMWSNLIDAFAQYNTKGSI